MSTCVPRKATLVEPNREGLIANRWYPRRLLLYSALLESANDSAEALAYGASKGDIERFYDRMNERAQALEMTDTTYHSASGLEDETNVSSARDQAIPVAHGERLYALAPEPKRFVRFPEGRHEDLEDHGVVAAVLWLMRPPRASKRTAFDSIRGDRP